MIGTKHVVATGMADQMCMNSIVFSVEVSVFDIFRNERHIQQDSYKSIFNSFMSGRVVFIINFGRFSGMRQFTVVVLVLMKIEVLCFIREGCRFQHSGNFLWKMKF